MELWEPFKQLALGIGSLTLQLLATWGLLIAWGAWWLLAVNWKKVWPALAEGAWAPAVLLVILTALVWSQMVPSDCGCLGFMTIANFWWQLGVVSMLAALALFCGWLQDYFGWTPAEFSFDPAPVAGHVHHDHGGHHQGGEHAHHDHSHGHGHHDHGHHDHGHHH
jgi:hypothetical protein